MLTGYTVLMLTADSRPYQNLGWVLEHKGCRVLRGNSGGTREEVPVREFDLVLAQIHREEGEELALLEQIKGLHPQVRLVLCSLDGETAFPLEAYQLEVDDYLLMPCRLAELWRRVAACLKKAAGKSRNLAVKTGGEPINCHIWEKSRPVCDYFRYNLGASAAALKSLIHTSAASLDKKLMAKIQAVSARLEVLQEMTEAFWQGISKAEAVACPLTPRTFGRFSRRHS